MMETKKDKQHSHKGESHNTKDHSAQVRSHDDKQRVLFKLAMSATFHCLIGCGIGEVLGIIIANSVGMGMIDSMILAVVLGFVAGLTLGIIPLIKAGFSTLKAVKTVVFAEGLSIVVMEGFEVLTILMIPGVMEAQLTDVLFWISLIAALMVGFIAALPVNYLMIKKGVRHLH